MLGYYEYIQNIIGDEIRQDNSKFIQSLSINELASIREKYHQGYHKLKDFLHKIHIEENSIAILSKLKDAPTPYRVEYAVPGEFQPIFHGQIHQTYIFGGDQGHPWESPDHLIRLANIKRYLMYSHRIILPDAMWYINQYISFVRHEDRFVTKTRIALINYLNFLYIIRELVHKGIISFYPQYEHTFVGFPKKLFHDKKFIEWNQSQNNDIYTEEAIDVMHPTIVELLFYCVRYKASCTLDNVKMEPILEQVLQFGESLGGTYIQTQNDQVAAKDRNVLKRLATIPLSKFDTLPIEEVIAVRQNAEGFHRWRERLRDGLLRIESENANYQVIQRAVAESLIHGRKELEAEISKSSMLNHLQEQSVQFVIGTLSGATGGAVIGGPPGAIVGAAMGAATTAGATAILNILREFFTDSSRKKTNAALLRHYTLWIDEPIM